MKTFAISMIAAAALAAGALELAEAAAAAPAGPGSAADTVAGLQASGYKVIVNRFGDAPLSACSVTSVRPGRAIIQGVVPTSGGDSIGKVLYTTVYIDVRC